MNRLLIKVFAFVSIFFGVVAIIITPKIWESKIRSELNVLVPGELSFSEISGHPFTRIDLTNLNYIDPKLGHFKAEKITVKIDLISSLLHKPSLNYLNVSEIGSVVNVASMAGINAIGSSVAYAASKAALINMTTSLARALGPIKVNAVCPGFIEGEWLKKGLGEEIYNATRETIMNTNPLGKVCTPVDVANAIYYLACGQEITTGETLILDGGSYLGGNPLK